MNPPIVYDVTMPSSHRHNRITKIVQSMTFLLAFADDITEARPECSLCAADSFCAGAVPRGSRLADNEFPTWEASTVGQQHVTGAAGCKGYTLASPKEAHASQPDAVTLGPERVPHSELRSASREPAARARIHGMWIAAWRTRLHA